MTEKTEKPPVEQQSQASAAQINVFLCHINLQNCSLSWNKQLFYILCHFFLSFWQRVLFVHLYFHFLYRSSHNRFCSLIRAPLSSPHHAHVTLKCITIYGWRAWVMFLQLSTTTAEEPLSKTPGELQFKAAAAPMLFPFSACCTFDAQVNEWFQCIRFNGFQLYTWWPF